MPAEQHAIKEIFLAAAEMPVTDRAVYLDTACGDNTELRNRIEALLNAHDAPGDFTGAYVPSPDTPDSSPEIGTRIGPYELLHQIGEGGMGTVFMAEQTRPVQRKVALKVIKPGMDTAQVIVRFEAERQALAMMDHVNIARVLDAGATEAGRPYFVMELVHGVPITKYCNDNHLTPRERLELFIPVCQAIQHAHQKGIIHRDIKPSNVMITLYDGKPVPKVIDFGVAKATEQKLTQRTLCTQYGAMVGTLEYMSPEQAETSALGVDTRSDIFSLGVLLYELLTGSTPLSAKRIREAAYGEILRMIKEEEPPKPSNRLSDSGEALTSISAQRLMEPAKLAKLLRGELDWIVMKCLDKDRNRRYETANALAADIQRYLNDEPVQACPPSSSYRFRKFVRRHRAGVIAVGLVTFTLMAGIVGTTLGLVHAKRAEAEAIDERNEKQTALDNLVEEQKKTQAALIAQTRARLQAYAALRTLTDDLADGLLARQRQLGPNEQAYLRKVVSFFDQLAREYGDNLEAWKVQGDGYWLVGRIRVTLGETVEAEAAYRDALAARMRLLTEFPDDPTYRLAVAECQVEVGKRVATLGRFPEAESFFRDAIAILARLASDGPNNLKVSSLLVHSHDRLGLLLMYTGRLPEAEAEFREAIAVGCKEPTVDSLADPRHRAVVAASHDDLALFLAHTGHRKEAEAAHHEALVIRQKLTVDFPVEPGFQCDLAKSHMNLGVEYANTDRIPQAEAAFRECVTIMRKLVAEYPLAPLYRERLTNDLANLGTLLAQTGREQQAEEMHREAITLLRQLCANFPADSNFRRELAAAQFNLASACHQMTRVKEAEAAYHEAIALQTKLVAESTDTPGLRRELSRSYGNLGNLLSDLGRNIDAETAYREAVNLDVRLVEDFPSVPEHAISLGGSCCNLGNLFQSTDRAAEAMDFFDRAVAALNAVVTAQPRLVKARMFLRNSHAGRAETLAKLNRYAEAVTDWDRAIELSSPIQRSMVQMNRALCLARAGETAKATQAADQALAAPKPNGRIWYDAACVFAVSAAAPTDDKELCERYAARAVELLGLARAAGYFRQPGTVENMKKDTDLDALRQRDDYRKLLEVFAKGASSPNNEEKKP